MVNAGRKATLVLLSNLAGAGLGYLALLLIGRYFAPAAYGAYLFALSLAGLIAVLSNLGLGVAHQRHIAQGTDPGRALGILVRLRLAILLPLLAVAALSYLAWSAWRGEPVTDATTPAVLGMALAVQVFSSTRQALFDTWQGQQLVHRIEAVRTLDTVLSVALLGNAALLLAHLQGRWEVFPAAGAFWARTLGLDAAPSAPEAAFLLAGCYLAAKTVSLLVAVAWSLSDRLGFGPWDRDLARSYIRFAAPLAFTAALVFILQYTDSLMLGFFWSAREVGLYGAAQRLTTLCLLGATAVGTVLFPRFAQLHAAGDLEREAATFRKAERYLLLLVTPLAAAMVALPREGLHIAVGDEYLGAAMPLRFLALWALAATLGQAMASRMLGTGQIRILVRATLLNAVGNVVLNFLLIPPGAFALGPTGAALATLLSTLVSYAYLRLQTHRLHGTGWVSGAQVRILSAGAVTAAFWFVAKAYAGPAAFDRVWELTTWGVAGGLLYGGLLATFRELHGRDLVFLRKVAHPRALVAEMRGR